MKAIILRKFKAKENPLGCILACLTNVRIVIKVAFPGVVFASTKDSLNNSNRTEANFF